MGQRPINTIKNLKDQAKRTTINQIRIINQTKITNQIKRIKGLSKAVITKNYFNKQCIK